MSFALSEERSKRLDEIIAKYPDSRSAVMPALYLVQEEIGQITDEAIDHVAERVGLAPVHVMELVTFYTMYHRKKLGKYHVQVCRTLSCALLGSKKLMEYLHERLGVEPYEATQDGNWSYEAVECLGSCGTAPMCEINDHYFENLTPEKLAEFMDRIEKEQPDLAYSTLRDDMGAGLQGVPKSEIV